MNARKVILLCLVGLLLSTAAHAKLVFGSERNGVEGVYVMDDDGSNQTLLIDEGAPYPASWSPDGTQILFKSLGAGLSFMDPDGTNIRRLTEKGLGSIGKCSFSPDGNFIVYDRVWTEDNNQKYNIEVMNIKTGEREVISERLAAFCDWSPDGKHIIFAESLSPNRTSTLWIMGADGHNPRPLIPNPGPQPDNFHIYRERSSWSPNSQQIVFTETELKWERVPDVGNVGNALIYKAFRYMIYDRTSDNIRKLSIPKDWQCYGIDWMDDGDSVVFTARTRPIDIPIVGRIDFTPCYVYKYHIKTHVITQLTDDPGWDQIIDWISDDVLSVSPKDKKKVTWGTLKQ